MVTFLNYNAFVVPRPRATSTDPRLVIRNYLFLFLQNVVCTRGSQTLFFTDHIILQVARLCLVRIAHQSRSETD